MPNTFLRRRSSLAALALVAAALACHRDGKPNGGSTDPDPALLSHPSGDTIVVLAVGGRPHGVAVSPNGRLVVSQIDASSIAIGTVSATTQSFDRLATVGSTPAHVALDHDGAYAYTANQYGQSASIVRVSDAATIATLPLPTDGFNVLAAPDRARAYVTTSGGTLHVIDTKARTLIAALPVGTAANGLAYDAAGARLYVSSIFGGTISVIDVEKNSVVNTIAVGGGPQRIALSRDAKTLYVASQQYGLQVVTLATGAVRNITSLPAGSVGLAVTPDGAQVWVTNPPMGNVSIVDAGTLAVTRTLHSSTGIPRNVTFTATGHVGIFTDESGLVVFVR